MGDPHPNHVVNFNQANLSWHLRVHVLLQKAGKVDHQNHDFLTVQMATKLKERISFFLRWRAGDDHER